MPPRSQGEASQNIMEKVQMPERNKSYKEYSLRGRKKVVGWQAELTCPQKAAGFIDICLQCSVKPPGDTFRLWYGISLVLQLSEWWRQKQQRGHEERCRDWRLGWLGVNKERAEWKKQKTNEIDWPKTVKLREWVVVDTKESDGMSISFTF